MEEEFYSTIKLSTGEELVAKVCYLPEEDSLLVEKPMLVEALTQKKNGKRVEGFILKEWIRSSYDDMFVVKMEQIVTMSELDEKIKRFYLGNLDKDYQDENKIKPKKLKNNNSVKGSKDNCIY